jgi:ATP-dependent DNA helicase RecQ
MSLAGTAVDLERTLRERFGLEQFRPGQRPVIECVLQGRDVLCVMPTGGGKSLCYQLPALLLRGLTLVVSPLIALMKDQVDALVERGVRATLINSSLDPAEQRARILEIEAGQYDLVYVAPERFRSSRFVAAMASVRPALLAVDEAHCISEWGHDFRPDYAKIGRARRQLGMPACIALTATATDIVRRDIADQLDLRDPAQFVTGFDRPNLRYAALEAGRDADKLAALREVLDRNPGPAVVYTSSRKRCEMVAQYLERELRRSAVIYHAGLGRDERTVAQERFMTGHVAVVVATNAFGMGVDKADIRSVIHFNMPGTLEAYYQEAGRAGRDGRTAECMLLFAYADRLLQELFIENEYPPAEMVYQVYDFLRQCNDDPIELTQNEIRALARIELNEQAVGTALKILEAAGAIEKFRPRENMAIVRINAEPDEPGASLATRLHPQANIQRIVLLALEGLVNRRYGEPVYFHPDEFAAILGLDRTPLTRALRALSSELPIDYIPPFRGNALRVVDRVRKPRDLGIDFVALEKRKQREYDKLERMVKYAESRRCRRAVILGYFGDTQAARIHCGHCDNCGAVGDADGAFTDRPIDTPAGQEVLLKVLSGVARAKGRFGKTVVAQMLAGSASEKIQRLGLARLSTYGLLSAFRHAELVQILEALERAGLLECPEVDRFRPVVNLTAEGWQRLRSKGPLDLPLTLPEPLRTKVLAGGDEQPASETAATTDAPPVQRGEDGDPGTGSKTDSAPAAAPLQDDPLWQKLRDLRLAWAREMKVPPYVVFSNRVLDEIVRTRPPNPQALSAVKGFGPARLERYGSGVLATINQASAAWPGAVSPLVVEGRGATDGEPPAPESDDGHPAEVGPARHIPDPAPPPQGARESNPTPGVREYVPTEEWTWRLLDRGFTLAEAAAIRGLLPADIIRHATLAVRQGRPLVPESILAPDVLRRWDVWRESHGNDAPPPADAGPAELWGLFVACRSRRPE